MKTPLRPFRLLFASVGLVIVSIALLAGFGLGTLIGWITEGWFGVATLGVFSYITAFRLWLAAVRGITVLVTPKPLDVGWSRGLCGVLQR